MHPSTPGLVAVGIVALTAIGCASRSVGPRRPDPLPPGVVADRTVIAPGGWGTRFVRGADGSAVGVVYIAGRTFVGGDEGLVFRLVERTPGRWRARTEVLVESTVANRRSGFGIDPSVIDYAHVGENGWELLLHRNQVGAQHHRFRVTVRAGGDARSDDHWRHMVGRNLFGEEDEPWYRLAVRETSLRGAQLDYEHAALLMVSQRDDPDLIPSERLTILRDGHLESVDVPARVTGTSCRLPLPSPIPGGRVVRNDIGSVFASTAPESPYAMTFGVERPCPDGRSATSAPCPERAVLHVGVCDSGRGWRTLELGAGRHPAIHRDPDGTLLVARSLDDAMEILSVVLPRDPSARSTPSEVVPAL